MFNCYDGNNIIPLKLDSSGNLIKTINNERYNNNCYVICDNDSSSTNHIGIMSIFNNLNSNKKVYIYSIKVQTSGLSSLNSGIYIEIWKIQANPSDGSTISANKIKLINNDSSTHSCSIKKKFTSYSIVNKIYTHYHQFTSDSSDTESVFLLELYNEMIEIPENYGIVIKIVNSSTVNMNYSYNVKFIEK